MVGASDDVKKPCIERMKDAGRAVEPTAEEAATWAAWVAGRPGEVRALIEARALAPWKIYRIGPSGAHRVLLHSVDEHFGEPLTVRVAVLHAFNPQGIAFERMVFGVDPLELVECD